MKKVIFISLVTYLVFFFPLLNTNTYIGGEDPRGYHYPVKYFLYHSLQKGEFPFYTQRIFSGFPIYADPTAGYLNPLNIVFVMLFGPFNYYKVMHFLFYLIGSVSLYFYLMNRFRKSLLAFAAANLAFFFNLFILYQQKHFEIVLSFFMLPLCLLILDKFIFKPDIKKLFFLATVLLFDFYNGSFQILLLKLLILGVYTVVFDNMLVLNWRKYTTFLTFFALLSMPLLVPSIDLYVESSRNIDSHRLYEGSFAPVMAINIVYPFLMGNGEHYKWNQVSDEYFIHETYIYQGVSVFIVGLLGLLLFKDKKMAVFLAVIISLFIILAFVSYIPVFGSLRIPIISMFRYWGRSAFLMSFVLSLGVYNFLAVDAFVFNKQNLKIFLIPGVFFCLLLIFSLTQENTVKAVNLILNGAVKRDFNMAFWMLLVVSAILSVKFKSKKMILLLIFMDIVFFGLQVVRSQLVNVSEIKVPSAFSLPNDSVNNKMYVFNDVLYKNTGLYYASNGIFGYSQMEPERYLKYMREIGFSDTKHPTSFINKDFEFNNYEFYKRLEDSLGVNYIFSSNGDVVYTADNTSLPYIKDAQVKYIDLNESAFSFTVNSPENRVIHTFIRSYKDWEIFIDGIKTDPDYSDVFIKFNLPEGEHLVKFEYIPSAFIRVFLLSFLTIVVITSTYAAVRIRKNGGI